MTISNARQKMIDRVVKLLALAEGTNHTPEAEAARNMAIELMAKHNLTSADVAGGQESFAEKFENTGRQQAASYETQLLLALAKMNGVCLLIAGRSNYKFIGRPSDMEAFEYMRHIVYQQRSASWQIFYKQQWGKHPGAKELNRFKNGFAIGVARKINALLAGMDMKIQEWGLVPVNPADQALAWYKENNTVKNGNKGKGLTCSEAGLKAGKNVSLNKGVTGSTGNKLQIA